MAEFLGEASVLIRPDTTGFRAALEAAVLKASKGVVVPIPVGVAAKATAASRAAVVATTENAVANRQLATTAIAAAGAQDAAAAAAKAKAVADKQAAVAARIHATRLDQLSRGAITATASQAGLRGAVLASTLPFLAAVVGVEVLVKSLHEASDEQESLARVTDLLGASAGETSEKWAKSLAPSFGLAASEALRAQARFANLFLVQGEGVKTTEKQSQTLVQLAADLSAAQKVPLETTFKGLGLALAGNLRSLKTLGVVTTTAAITQRALTDSGKANADQLSRLDLVTARYNIILEQTKNVQGTVRERQKDLATQSNILRANLTNLGAKIGHTVVPVFTRLADVANEAFVVFGKLNSTKINIPGLSEADHAARGLADGLGLTSHAIDDAVHAAQVANSEFTAFGQVEKVVAGITDSLAASLANLFGTRLGAIKRLQGQAKGAGETTILGEIDGASPEQQIANLEAEARIQRRLIKTAKNHVEQRRDAEQELARIQGEIKSIRAQQAGDAKSAAGAAQSAANDAQAAKDKADQAFLDALEFRRGKFDIKIAIAENTKGLADDIRAQVAERNLILQQIVAIKRSGLAEKLKREAIQSLTALLVSTRGAIRALFKQQQENRKAEREAREARRKERQDALVESLQLDIEFNATNENVRGEIRARERLIKELRREQAQVKRGTREWKRLRNEIAAEQQAIKDLKKQTKEKNNAAASLQFEFLQAQQGFAANLLSNILPASAFAGTVGGVSGTTGGGLPISSFQGGREDPTRGLGGAAAIAQASQRTASQSQMSVLIELTRQIVRVLQGQQRGSQHPEARHQRASGSATMDIL